MKITKKKLKDNINSSKNFKKKFHRIAYMLANCGANASFNLNAARAIFFHRNN